LDGAIIARPIANGSGEEVFRPHHPARIAATGLRLGTAPLRAATRSRAREKMENPLQNQAFAAAQRAAIQRQNRFIALSAIVGKLESTRRPGAHFDFVLERAGVPTHAAIRRGSSRANANCLPNNSGKVRHWPSK
jgi:hypothetical protein